MAIRSAREAEVSRLYKFRGLSDRSKIEPIFRGQALYWPSVSQLNDPFESKPSIVAPPIRNEMEKLKVQRLTYELLRRQGMDRKEAKIRSKASARVGVLQECANEMTRELPAALEIYRIFSMAGNCHSILLWSHYAESHTGVCLVFSTDNQEFGDALEVTYSKDLATLDFFERGHEANLMAMVLTKSDEWKYEHEYRLISQEPTLHGLHLLNDHWYYFRPEHLVEVIMGCNIKPDDEVFIREMVGLSPTPIKLRKAARSLHRFALDIDDV